MVSFLKKIFIPHTRNGHRPHFLRNDSMRGLAGFILLIEFFVFIGITFGMTSGLSWTASVLPGVLGTLTNEQRVTQHLAVLTENPVLDQVATLKAQDMAEKGYFAHTSPEGLTPWHWFDVAGYAYEYAGENLAIDFTDSKDVTNAWMNSPTHRANIIKNSYTEIGTGIATGTFDGVSTVFVAQVYAKPASRNVHVVAIPVQTISTTTHATTTIATVTPQVLGATREIIEPTFWQKISLSPRHSANIIFGIIALWIVIALCIHVFVKKDARHVDLVLNGLIVLVLILGVSIVNKVITKHTQTSFQAFDGSGSIIQTK